MIGALLGFLLGIAVILFLYGVIWKWAIVAPVSLVLVLLRLDRFKISIFAINLLGYYVVTSILVLFTSSFTDLYKINDYHGMFAAIAGVFFFVGSLFDIGQKSNEARRNFDFESEEMLPYTLVALVIGIIYYIIAVINPVVAVNSMSLTLLKWIYAINQVQILHWIINIIGVVYALNMIFMGVMAALGLIVGLSSKFSRKNNLSE